MGALSEIILSFLNLMEAEGRAFRGGLIRVALGVALVMVIGVLALAALGLIITAIYLYLRQADVTPASSVLLDGMITLALVGVLAWSVRKLAR